MGFSAVKTCIPREKGENDLFTDAKTSFGREKSETYFNRIPGKSFSNATNSFRMKKERKTGIFSMVVVKNDTPYLAKWY